MAVKPSEAALLRAERAAQRIDEWRSHLLKLASGSIPDIPEATFLGREIRGAAVVAAMAELEAMLREMLISIGDVVNNSCVVVADLIPPLRPLATHSVFESLVHLRDSERVWAHRTNLTSLDASNDVAQLPLRTRKGPQPPLDGRTIQSRHLSLVWSVLGIKDPIPSASTVASLKKLTQIRNDVAHGNVDFAHIFSEAGRSAAEIEKYLDDVCLLILNIGSEWAEYVERESFLVHKGSPGTP